jgi:uncharacterized protein YqhQ
MARELKKSRAALKNGWRAKTGNVSMDVAIGVAVVLAVALAVGLFVFLPSLTTQLISWKEATPRILKSLTEGFVRLIIFLAYITVIALMKDIRRVYMYHGAEHKTIACYEHEAELTPENAMKYSRLHPRCGTTTCFWSWRFPFCSLQCCRIRRTSFCGF